MTVPALRTPIASLVLELEQAGALTATSLTLTDPDLPYDTYEALAHFFGRVNRASLFWIGDLLLFGERVYGESYAQAAEATGLAPQSLMNTVSVCKQVPKTRRRPNLSLSMHQEVAPLEPAEQKEWLKRAETEGWTRGQLRGELRAQRNGEPETCTCLSCGNLHRRG